MNFRKALFGLAVLLSGAAGGAHAAQSYADPKVGYSVEFPDGWVVATEPSAPGAVAGVGGQGTPELRVCLVTVVTGGPQSKLSQAQINQDMRAPFGDSFWQEMAGNSVKGAKVESSGSREHPSTLVAQEALLSFNFSATDPRVMRMNISVMMTPQYIYSIGCSAEASVHTKHKAEFLTFVNSFRHKAGMEAGVNPAPGSATPVAAQDKSVLGSAISRAAEILKNKIK